MADKKIMIDSTILIDYFRKTDKSKSKLVELSMKYDKIYISTVTEFEVINGASHTQLDFWNNMLKVLQSLILTAKLQDKLQLLFNN